MKKLWIDLTDMEQWSGHLTGIQRVVYNIALRYSERQDVHYFVFEEKSGNFYETGFEAIRDKVEGEKEQSIIQPARVSAVSRLKGVTVRLYQRSPDWLRDHATPARKEKLKKMYVKVKAAAKRPNPIHIRHARRQKAIFNSDDVLLVMGKPWDFPTFMERIRQEKIQHHFKLVQVVYDLIPVFFPQLHGEPLIKPFTQHMFEVGALSDGLLAISKSSKRDMVKFCKKMRLPVPPIEVIRLGDDFAQVAPVRPEVEDLRKDEFLLSVSTIEVRKNHALLYYVYKEAEAQGTALPKLVIVGGPGWYTQDILYEFTHDPQMAKKVTILQSVNDAQLAWLYDNCAFTIFPSIYEGWGLPIAESLCYGKLCLPSETSSMQEIAGSLLEYYSPYNSQQCLDLIKKYLDPGVRQLKEREVKDNYQPTTWEQTFHSFEKLITKLSQS